MLLSEPRQDRPSPVFEHLHCQACATPNETHDALQHETDAEHLPARHLSSGSFYMGLSEASRVGRPQGRRVGELCILLAKAAQEGVGLRSVPCRQILTTRHHFTPFSKTQGQLENAAGLQDVSKSYPLVRDGGGRLLHGACTSCSGALFRPPPIHARGGALSFCFRLLTTFGF